MLQELMRDELQSKNQAIAGYDSILWKIRSGYLVVLYGALSLTLKDKLEFSNGINPQLLHFDLLSIIGFSICALIIDLNFESKKRRVVIARDSLSEQAVKLATGNEMSNNDFEKIEKLLHNSGESGSKLELAKFWRQLLPILVLYTVTPNTVTPTMGLIVYWQFK